MSTILVEARSNPLCGESLDQIAATCRQLGHDVFRWRGPFSGRVPCWRALFDCDLAVLFNGWHPRYDQTRSVLQARGTQLLFVEVGWHPQRGQVQIDPQGINARASWAAMPLQSVGSTPLAVRAKGDLLVTLQLDDDTQIMQLSPHFANMRSFVEHLCQHSALPIRVRQHPLAPLDSALQRRLLASGGCLDASPSLAAAMANCRAVACINSSCGVEALDNDLPVLCFGEATYRHSGAVYCLDADGAATRAATEELAAGRCTLSAERIHELVSRILSHQWSITEIPQRLPALLDAVLHAPGLPRQSTWSARLLRPIRDLPQRLSFRQQATRAAF